MTTRTDPAIGVDVGASTISAGLVGPDGDVIPDAQGPTGDSGQVIATIVFVLERILGHALAQRIRAGGIGVSLPDIVNRRPPLT